MVALGVAQLAGEVEFEAYLVAHAHLQGWHQQLFTLGRSVRRQYRQAQVFHTAAAVAGLERNAADVLVVNRDVQARLILRGRRRVAVTRLQRNALVAPDEQVWWQVDLERDRIGLQAAHLELLWIIDELGEGHRPIGANPVRCIVGLAWRNLDPLDGHPATAQLALIEGECGRGLDEVGLVATKYQQQLGIAIGWVVDQLDDRTVHRGMIA